jgi:hypothetical protein
MVQNLFFTGQGSFISYELSRNSIFNVSGVYDGTYRKIYINGTLVTEQLYNNTGSYPTDGDRQVRIGMWGYPTYPRNFNGNIYNVAIYNR